MRKIKNLCVFCGARDSIDEKFTNLATKCGEMLAERGINLIYGGGNSGMMGAVSHATHINNGHITGIYPKLIHLIEPLSKELDNQLLVDSMFQRKELMIQKSDAFLILPGGFGTLDEFFEVLTLRVLGDNDKPIIICNFDGFWDSLLKVIEEIINKGFARENAEECYTVVKTLDEVFAILEG
jgi:uncharacterized protein (TIGR00730 family)